MRRFLFFSFTRLGATTFVILSVVTRIEMIYLQIRAHPLLKNEKRPLPVAVRSSKTSLLKLSNNYYYRATVRSYDVKELLIVFGE